jgi:hypothetical protein
MLIQPTVTKFPLMPEAKEMVDTGGQFETTRTALCLRSPNQGI